ncbi:GIY-YIG nuclease family protein [Pedobacter cryotolerans]|nr:GIY-YIG nuclease family protein [Pedobacter cryotolerans]
MSGKAFLFLEVFMFYLYILYSKSSDKYYVGYTNDPQRRLHEHNNSLMTTYTSKHRPWILRVVYACGHVEADALKIEKFVKKQKSRKLIEKLIEGGQFTGILAQLVSVTHVRD